MMSHHLRDYGFGIGTLLQQLGYASMHRAAVRLHHRFVGDALQQGMTKFVRGPGVIVPSPQDLRLDQRLQRLDDRGVGIRQQRAEKVRRKRASDTSRGLNDAPPAFEAVKPFGQHLAQGERQIGRRLPSASGARADERENQLLDEQRDAVARRGRPGQQSSDTTCAPGTDLRLKAFLALEAVRGG
jgi:hypothetical protein